MKDRKLNDIEIHNAIAALFKPALDAFSTNTTGPMYLQDVEDFSKEVMHFDEYWYRFSRELQNLAEERGVKIRVRDDMIELNGTEYASVTFTLCDIEEDADSFEIDFSELEGMTRDEAIEYLEDLPSDIQPFWYVEVDLSNFKSCTPITSKVVTAYPDKEILSKLFDCFDNETKVIEEAELKAEMVHAELIKRDADNFAGTTTIVEGLKSLGWTGKFVVEKGYSSFILMIRLQFNQAARIGGSPEEIVNKLPDFLSFCKDYPHVENPKAYFVRTQRSDSTNWVSL